MIQPLATILFLSFSGGADMYDDVRVIARDEAATDGFVLESGGGERTPLLFYTAAARRASNDDLDALVYKVANDDQADVVWENIKPQTRTRLPNQGFSSLPLGSLARAGRSERGSPYVQATDGHIIVQVQINLRENRPQETQEGDKITSEGVARRTLARCRGLQAQSAQNINVNGIPVGSVTGPRGERLVDLVGYCQARGLELTTNQRLGTASFTQGGEQVIIPLAALKIKDGPRWIETRDISLIKNGRWYVSYEGLESTR
ncbi:MAG: hypothetical protein ACR2HJ_12210 [Fimbriimonadales bacterium]